MDKPLADLRLCEDGEEQHRKKLGRMKRKYLRIQWRKCRFELTGLPRGGGPAERPHWAGSDCTRALMNSLKNEIGSAEFCGLSLEVKQFVDGSPLRGPLPKPTTATRFTLCISDESERSAQPSRSVWEAC